MPIQVEHEGVNVVLRGNFNPAIFHPAWLGSQDLVRTEEAEEAEVEIVHRDMAAFQFDWLQLRVTGDRFLASTAQEPFYEVLRDLVAGIFDVLEHTPIRVLGINRVFHYRLESEEAWHALGDRLAPKGDWEELIKDPGMKSLMIQGARSDRLDGYMRVKVEPSSQVKHGVFIEVNDHYQLVSSSEPQNAVSVSESGLKGILVSRWGDSLKRSLEISQQITSLSKEL